MILGDASTKDLNKGDITRELLLGLFGQGLGAGIGTFMQRFTAEDIDRLSQVSADRLYDLAQQNGIRITPAEATNLQSQIAEQKRLMGVPRSANQMGTFTRPAIRKWRTHGATSLIVYLRRRTRGGLVELARNCPEHH